MVISRIPRHQWIILMGAILCFSVLSVIANTDHVPAFDRSILLFLRDPMDSSKEFGPSWLMVLMRDITALGSNWILLFFCFVYAIYLILVHKLRLAKYLVVTVVVGTMLTFLLKLGFERLRPELVPHGARVYTSSFPSGHAVSSSLVWLTLAFIASWDIACLNTKLFLVSSALFISLLVAFSRLYMGVHWPTDVLAGLCLGIFWAMFCNAIALYFKGTP